MRTATSRRTEKLDIRLTPEAKEKLYLAAKANGRTVSDFVLESALGRADEILPDRRHFALNAGQWEKFLAALDAPLKPRPRLERLLREPSVLERKRRASR